MADRDGTSLLSLALHERLACFLEATGLQISTKGEAFFMAWEWKVVIWKSIDTLTPAQEIFARLMLASWQEAQENPDENLGLAGMKVHGWCKDHLQTLIRFHSALGQLTKSGPAQMHSLPQICEFA